MSFIKLEQDAAFAPQLEFDNHEPMRLIIIGDLGDDTVTQELHIDANGIFKGEVVVIADPVAGLYSSVEIEIRLWGSGVFEVVSFLSTGLNPIESFYSHRLEVFR